MKRSEESRQRYLKAKALVAGGMTRTEALKQAHISGVSWYKNKKLEASGKSVERATAKRSYTKKAKFIDLAPSANPNIAIIVCSPSQIKNVLAGLE